MSTIEVLEKHIIDQLDSIESAILIIGRENCQKCSEWQTELRQWMESGNAPSTLRVFSVSLDSHIISDIVNTFDWIRHIDVLPMNVFLQHGLVQKQWAGGSIQRLSHRISRYV